MTSNSTKSSSLQSEAHTVVQLLEDWFDPIEARLRDRVREFIQAMIESELETALARPRYGRRPTADIQNGGYPEWRISRMATGREVFAATGTLTARDP